MLTEAPKYHHLLLDNRSKWWIDYSIECVTSNPAALIKQYSQIKQEILSKQD